jgi:phenylalanyl-tRNA synthetase beta chain
MQISRNWLQKYAPAVSSVHRLAETLTLGVAEVDEIRDASSLKQIKVGEITSLEKHPEADTLWLTEVKIGPKTHKIVCGAQNLAVGEKVPVALPGTTLPDGLRIAKRKIRGRMSDGMLCSPKELGIGEDHAGIWLLPADAKSGISLAGALKGAADSIELDVPANRPDLFGYLGVAREYAALTDTRLKEPKLKFAGRKKTGLRMVKISDREMCRRFTHARLTGVTNGPSPAWLKEALTQAGVRPISAVVDVTNYVMLETGQPLHAYDSTKLTGTVLFARRSKPDEVLTTLDGKRRALQPGTPVIADRTQAVGLAGIMGGRTTEVSKETVEVDLECASFDPVAIRQASRKLGLRTDASSRFEKGLPPASTLPAIRRAIDLLQQICGAKVVQFTDEYPRPERPQRVRASVTRINRLLGTTVKTAEAKRRLKRFGFTVTGSGDAITAAVPYWRPDVSHEADLAEEVARSVGYDTLPATLPRATLTPVELPPVRRLEQRVAEPIRAAGYSEVMTHSLVGADLLERTGFPTKLVRMANPLSADHAYLRGNMGPRHLEAVAANLRWGDRVAVYELGHVFEPAGRQKVTEQRKLLVTLATKSKVDVLGQLRGVLEALTSTLGFTELDFATVEVDKFVRGRHWQIAADGVRIGWIGEYAHPERFKAGRIGFLSLNLDYVQSALPTDRQIIAPSELPPAYRDLSVFVPDDSTYADLRRLVTRTVRLPVTVSDPSEYIADGKRSLAVRLTFQAVDRTLTDKQVRAEMAELETALKAAGYTLRG